MDFSNGFLLGAVTAAHQVEGGNTNSDCWTLEQIPHTSYAEPSGDAVDHYHRFEEDIRLLAEAGLNAYRFTVEWARIEPEEGHFDEREIEHYRSVMHCCKRYGVEPVVSLHHFSSPRWLISKGGWEAKTTPADFGRYAKYIMERLGGELKYVITINEANIGLQIAAIAERYKKQMMQAAAKQGAQADGSIQMGLNIQDLLARQQAAAVESAQAFGVDDPRKVQVFQSSRTQEGDRIVALAHREAMEAVRAAAPHVKAGISLSLRDLQTLPGGEEIAQREWDEEYLHYLPYLEGDDFLCVQNYTRFLYDASGQLPVPQGAEVTQMNYEFYPDSLEHVIRRVAKDFHGPLLIGENGVSTTDDERRVEFIRRAISGVKHCIRDGLPVFGYLYWSLLDNFEWQKGFEPRFGLIAVDRATQRRTPKPSLTFLGTQR